MVEGLLSGISTVGVKGYGVGPSAQPFSESISPAASRPARPPRLCHGDVVVFGDESDGFLHYHSVYSLIFHQ
jgi:hypothetical protein